MLLQILRGCNPYCLLRHTQRFHQIVRHASSTSNQPVCHKLTQRAVVRVAGRDASPFLQSLITNDMSCLHGDCEVHAMYALMLNVQGRVTHDLLLYNIVKSAAAPPVFLIECDANRVQEFVKLLKQYKIRKKVDISQVSDEYSIWSVFPSKLPPVPEAHSIPSCSGPLGEQYRVKVSPSDKVLANDPDPRLRSFARRLVLTADMDACDVVEDGTLPSSPSLYDARRYELGVAEGEMDMPPGASIPLENNAVFMNGVSFQKGCYIGQELTARTHHTGVIRKRLMPLKLNSSSHKAQPGDKVENEAGKNVGKFRNSVDEHGLALLRINDVIGQNLRVTNENGDVVAEGRTWIPYWWPREADEVVKRILEEKPEATAQA